MILIPRLAPYLAQPLSLHRLSQQISCTGGTFSSIPVACGAVLVVVSLPASSFLRGVLPMRQWSPTGRTLVSPGLPFFFERPCSGRGEVVDRSSVPSHSDYPSHSVGSSSIVRGRRKQKVKLHMWLLVFSIRLFLSHLSLYFPIT